MTVDGYPSDDLTNPTTELEWRRLIRWMMQSGVMRGEDNALLVAERAAGANMSVDVATGQAFIVGHYVRSDAVESVPISNNATGNPRIDTLVVGFDFAANTADIYVLEGTAAAAPAPTALTQDILTKWEIPLGFVYVAAGESTSITTSEISDNRQYAEPVEQVGLFRARFATTAALAASTITGTSRVANANGALGAVDGVTGVPGDDLLDKDHATGSARGLWRIVDVGSASKPWRMVRSPFADTSAKFKPNSLTSVSEGTPAADKWYQLTTNAPIVLGTTSQTWAEFGASSSPSVPSARARRTGGTITANSGTWANVDTGIDLTLSGVVAGDVIEVSFSAHVDPEATDLYLDVVSIVSAAPVNSWGDDSGAFTGYGVQGSYCPVSVHTGCAFIIQRAVVSGDLSGGTLTLRLRYRQATVGNKSIRAVTGESLAWSAKNLRQ